MEQSKGALSNLGTCNNIGQILGTRTSYVSPEFHLPICPDLSAGSVCHSCFTLYSGVRFDRLPDNGNAGTVFFTAQTKNGTVI